MSGTESDSAPPAWLQGLLEATAYDHPVAALQRVETHISWVFLTGSLAYKIKKPVDFGFLDFSTLERRRHFCEEELRLNRRYAPDLYLGVVPITGPFDRPRVNGTGPAIEYAVKMRQFAEADLLEHCVRDGRLLPRHMDALAENLAAFHRAAGLAGADDRHGLPERIREAARQNFAQLRGLAEPVETASLAELEAWTEAEYRRLRAVMARRKREGYIRECHGDLHLGNLVLIEDRPTPFDGIEFNEDLRWIDCLSELAFPVMDLEVHGASALAWRFLNRYLELTGDYRGLGLFDFYRVYRAMVRAKIAQLTRQPLVDPVARQELQHRYTAYIGYARALIRPRRPALIITHGFSGSGKSRLAGRLAERLPAVRIRSDVERKRLAGLSASTRAAAALGEGIYTRDLTRQTYAHLAKLAETLLRARHSVILDATFLSPRQRERQRRVAERRGAPFVILDCQAPMDILRERVRSRGEAGKDPSDADLAVLENQFRQSRPLTPEERPQTLVVDTSGEDRCAALLRELRARLGTAPRA